jgi:hypothetical protein
MVVSALCLLLDVEVYQHENADGLNTPVKAIMILGFLEGVLILSLARFLRRREADEVAEQVNKHLQFYQHIHHFVLIVGLCSLVLSVVVGTTNVSGFLSNIAFSGYLIASGSIGITRQRKRLKLNP